MNDTYVLKHQELTNGPVASRIIDEETAVWFRTSVFRHGGSIIRHPEGGWTILNTSGRFDLFRLHHGQAHA